MTTPSSPPVPPSPVVPPADLPDLAALADLSIPFSAPLDVPAYLNAHFPTESSLNTALEPLLTRLDATLASLDAQLAALISAHRHAAADAAPLIHRSHLSVHQTTDAVRALTRAAADAEHRMRAALLPARPLHLALHHTAATAAALDALVALDAAVATLERAAAAAPSLDLAARERAVFARVREALAVFDALPTVEGAGLRRLPELRARAAVAEESLRVAVLAEFQRRADVVSMAAGGGGVKVDEAVAGLKTACVVVGAMGEAVRAEVVGVFVRGRRSAFKAAFAMDEGGFAGVEKRFSWLRRELRANWARLGGERVDRGWGKVFPDEWGVAWRLADGIVKELREWTVATLDAGADRDVAIMVSALGKTKEFEAELDRRFASMKGDDIGSFVGAVSEAYGPWMGAYVAQEDEHLAAVLQELVREETWVCTDGAVLRSATELFLVIKKSMRTCAALDIKQPLFSLHRVFRKNLGVYAASLINHLPGVRGNALADSSKPKEYEEKVRRACAIISTAEYCSATVEQLEEALQKTVQEVYAADIELGAEREKFATVAARGIQSIVALLDEDLEVELKKLMQQDWAVWKEVGDNSKAVEVISAKLAASVKSLSASLTKYHFRFMLEKFAASFISRYHAHVYACQQMNSLGAQQILLDASAIKAILLGLPASVHAPVPGTYVKYVQREMGKIEAVLKVILAPVNVSVDTYVALVPEGTAEHFQKVLEMRGLRRADAAPLVLDYSRRIGPAQRLRPQLGDAPRRPRATDAALETRPAGPARVSDASGSSLPAGPAGPAGQTATKQGQAPTVDSVKSLFGRWGTSLMDSGISEKLEQVGSQFESTTDRLKKEAAARGFRFGQ